MSIAELIAVAPPPETIVQPKLMRDWSAIEKELGITLPNDYRIYGITYGCGGFYDKYLQVINPFYNYLDFIERDCDRLRSFPSEVPFPIYPEPGCLVPWGMDENGGRYFWLTEGRPDRWPIVLQSHTFHHEVRKNISLTTLLAKVLNNKLRSKILRFFPYTRKRVNFQPIPILPTPSSARPKRTKRK